MRSPQSNASRLKPAHEKVEYPFYTSDEEIIDGILRCLKAAGYTGNLAGLEEERRLAVHRNHQENSED